MTVEEVDTPPESSYTCGENLCVWEVKRKKKVTNKPCGKFLCSLYFFLLLGALAFIILVVYGPGKKGWTEYHGLHTTTFKVSGTAEDDNTPIIWDAADLADPPEQASTLFMTTNLWRIRNQTFNEFCPTSRQCEHDEDCKDIGFHIPGGKQHDGICGNRRICEVHDTWCPFPEEEYRKNLDFHVIKDLSNIKVTIRNTVFFLDGKKNIAKNITNVDSDVRDLTCEHDSGDNKWCPVFTMKKILSEAGISDDQGIQNIINEGMKSIVLVSFSFLQY